MKPIRTYVSKVRNYTKKIKLSAPEKCFLILSTIFGLLFVFITPPYQVPDENVHFFRTYQLSERDLFSTKYENGDHPFYGTDLPKSLADSQHALLDRVQFKTNEKIDTSMYGQYINQPLAQDEREIVLLTTASVYSPAGYIPQIIGMTIGKAFDASPLVLMWLGRLMNLALWVAMVFLALRLIPFAKWAFVVLALNPMAVFLSASLSPDVTNIAAGFLFFAVVASSYAKRSILSKKYTYALLAILLIVLSLTKPVNVLFGLLLFTMPVKFFGSKKVLFAVGLGMLAAAAIVAFWWNYQVRDVLDVAINGFRTNEQYVNGPEQLMYILSNPVEYIRTIFNNFFLVIPGSHADNIFITFFGVFGWLDTRVPIWVIISYILLLFLTLLYQAGRNEIVLNWTQKSVYIATILVFFLGTITALYINATIVGDEIMGGVQGRYFIPISILIIGIVTARKRLLNVSHRNMNRTVWLTMSGVLCMSIVTQIVRFY